ncbi:MAG: SPOR domain-containing protein [Prevotella sp.]|nr:SPOR domain-containing protein [Prevotella sp.]
MIELERHIEIQLLNNDCVIVPDLGGFMAHYEEAHYDSMDGSFLPPKRTLGFNPALKMNDSLLVQSYIEAYDISYPEALHRIEDEVNELRQHIESEGFYELNDIGILRVNDYGNYEFEPCEAGILTPSLYGLNSLEIDSLDKPNSTLIETKVAPIKLDATDKQAEKDVVREEPLEKPNSSFYISDDDERTVHIRVSVLRNAVAVAIALLAFFLFSTPLNNNLGKGQQAMNINTDVLTKIMPKSEVKGNASVSGIEDVADNTEEDAKAKAGIPQVTVNSSVSSDSTASKPQQTLSFYTLVLASHVSQKNAAAFVEKLHKVGFNEAEVSVRNKVTRVIFNRYSTESEAYKALNNLQEYSEFNEAWVYYVKGV